MASDAQFLLMNEWICRVIFLLSFFIYTYIFKCEYKKRKQQPIPLYNNIYEKLLDIWSILTIISTILTAIFYFIGRFPWTVCLYANILGSIFFSYGRIFLSFYQLSRLQYCFLEKQIHSKKYGYPNWLFYLLYIIGICITLFVSIILWFISNILC